MALGLMALEVLRQTNLRRPVEEVVALVGQLVAPVGQEGHTAVALEGDTTSTLTMGLHTTAASALSASSGALVAAIRRTPQTSN